MTKYENQIANKFQFSTSILKRFDAAIRTWEVLLLSHDIEVSLFEIWKLEFIYYLIFVICNFLATDSSGALPMRRYVRQSQRSWKARLRC